MTTEYQAPINGSITAVSQTVDLTSPNSGTSVIQVQGTWTGTLVLEGSNDDANYVAIDVMDSSTGLFTSTITSNSVFLGPTNGFKSLQLRSSAWTSGTATIDVYGSDAASVVNTVSQLRGATDGTLIGNDGNQLLVADATARTSLSNIETSLANMETYTVDSIPYVTTTPLANGATYSSGILQLSLPYSQVQTAILASHDGVIRIYWYSDAGGTDVIRNLNIPYTASSGYQLFAAPTFGEYVKYDFENNSGSNQTDFYYETKFLNKSISGQLLTMNAPIAGAMVGNLTRSVLSGQNDNGDYVNAKVNNARALEVATRDYVHDLPVKYTANGMLKSGTETIIGDFRLDQQSLPRNFDVTYVGSGTWDIEGGATGARLSVKNAGDALILESKETMYYQSGRGINMRISMITGDAGVTGLKREWGMICQSRLNGMWLRLDGTTLSWVIAKDGVETVIPSNTWDTPVVHDGNGAIWETQMLWLGVGNIHLYRNEQLVHTYRFQGTSTNFSLTTPDLRVFLNIENTSNNDARYMKIGCCAVMVEGGNNARRLDQEPEANDLASISKAAIIGLDPEDDDGYHQAYVSDDRELHVYNRMNILQYKELIFSLNAIQREMKETKELIGKIFEEEPKKGDSI